MNNLSARGVDGAADVTPLFPGSIRARGVLPIVMAIILFAGAFAFAVDARASAADAVATTDELNLRAEPALNATILDVMPAGAVVEIVDAPVAGFYPVSYNGATGWAYSAYLTTGFTGDGLVTTGGQQGEVYVADGPVNFRTGPSTDDTIMAVIPDGALVALNGDSANGFVSIIYADTSGWAHADSIFGTATAPAELPVAPAPPAVPEAPAAPEQPASVPVGDAVTGTATVIDGELNLRLGPGTDYGVALVMPGGAAVELRGEPQAGFFPVSFNGTTGWAFADFLQVGGAEGPPAPEAPAEPEAPAPETPVAPPAYDGSDGYTEDEIIAIIYEAADAYGQPREDMLRVARCESVLDPNAVNASSQASGLFQFLPSTWQRTPYANQSVFDPVANAYATAWMWAQGNRGEWVCQ